MSVQPKLTDAVYVNSNEELDRLCVELSKQGYLALDTEFIRTNTFYSKPGLIQLGGDAGIFLVDPLKISNWENFGFLLSDKNITTIMHSSGEDLSLLYYMLGVVPANLFDTQRAAAFLGHGYSLSYQALVKAELDIDVPKGETRSDWLKRPLTESQLSYAALDVAYLEELAVRLKEKLKTRDMFAWFEHDCNDLLEAVKDESIEDEWGLAYKNISGAWKLDDRQLKLLQKLCFWREKTARKRDRPRSWILKDAELLSLALELGSLNSTSAGESIYSADMVRDAQILSPGFANREADGIANALNESIEFPEPASTQFLDGPLSPSDRKRLKAIQQLTRQKAEELEIAPELLARKRQWLQLLASFNRGGTRLWEGELGDWRRKILEPDVTAILEGVRPEAQASED